MSGRDADGFTLDRRAVARAFGRAGPGYDAVATLQATVRAELLDRLGHFALAPRVVIDAGAGTGASSDGRRIMCMTASSNPHCRATPAASASTSMPSTA